MSKTNNQTIAAYNKTAEKYIQTSPQKVSAQLGSWIDKNLSNLDKSAKILEIGSGSGKDADYIESRGYTIQLTDASQGFVDYLRAKGKTARLLNAITDDLGLGYDMVFADAVFVHFTQSETDLVIKKIYKSLNQSGRLAFSLKAGSDEETTNRKINETRYFRYWQPADIKEVLKIVGFASIEIQVIDDYRGKARPDWLLIIAVKGMG